MGTTTNNGWPTPVATDLVKDGWEAIKDLGDAIDTTLGVYSPATPMGVHLSTVTFSGVASQSAPANTFSATYRNYRILIQCTGTSASSAEMRFRVRAAGTDLTSNYNCANKFMAFNTTTTFDVATSPTDRINLGYIPNAGDGRFTGSFDLMNPQASLITGLTGMSTGTNTGAYRGFGISGGYVDNTTSYDSFTIYPTAGNITGTLHVFGYNE
jgi:hypothetical protein